MVLKNSLNLRSRTLRVAAKLVLLADVYLTVTGVKRAPDLPLERKGESEVK